jgi:hypothetical protein
MAFKTVLGRSPNFNRNIVLGQSNKNWDLYIPTTTNCKKNAPQNGKISVMLNGISLIEIRL